MRINFNSKFKKWKNRKKYGQKSIEGYFLQGTKFTASCRRYTEKACQR